jgi:hypothetical protein
MNRFNDIPSLTTQELAYALEIQHAANTRRIPAHLPKGSVAVGSHEYVIADHPVTRMIGALSHEFGRTKGFAAFLRLQALLEATLKTDVFNEFVRHTGAENELYEFEIHEPLLEAAGRVPLNSRGLFNKKKLLAAAERIRG